jgi:hypothetical protein
MTKDGRHEAWPEMQRDGSARIEMIDEMMIA